jgi:hypothetical protein
MGFTQIRSDASIFVWDHEGTKVIVPVVVDDITLASKSKTKIQDIKQELASTSSFEISALPPSS